MTELEFPQDYLADIGEAILKKNLDSLTTNKPF
jgi:hypothetical protein